MMKRVNIIVGLALLLLEPICSLAGMVTFQVVGEYDGSSAGNVVDKDAGFYEGNSSGSGDDASLALKIGTFRAEILKAFTNGCGGVVGFDNTTIVAGSQTDSFAASFGEDKTLIVTSVGHIRNDVVATNVFLPISGPGTVTNGGFLYKSDAGGDNDKIGSTFNFTFEEQGFAPQEHVQYVAGTILGRNYVRKPESSRWLMKAILDNGDVVAQMSEINFRNGKSRDDTFFGVKAPEGRYITSVLWVSLDGNKTGLDGFAFITNGKPKRKSTPSENEGTSSSSDLFGIPVGGSGSSGSSDSGGYSTLFGREHP